MRIAIIIPALNEQSSVGEVVRRTHRCLSASGEEFRIVVSDNESTDRTAAVARHAGAEVVFARPRGYGSACLTALRYLGDWPDVLVFLEADGSSRPEEIPALMEPLAAGEAELVLGARTSSREMTLPQRFGTSLAVRLVNLRWRSRFSDMGPFRSILRKSLERLEMRDLTWGWTIEMQVLALRRGLKMVEVPVSWCSRIAGESKISGTVSGVLRAGVRILWTVGKYSVRRRAEVR